MRRRPGAAGEGVAKIEVTLLEPQADGSWPALAKPLRKLREGEAIRFSDALSAEVLARDGGAGAAALQPGGRAISTPRWPRPGRCRCRPISPRAARPTTRDREDYQTVWARQPGAVAAPTASLHFDAALLAALAAQGVEFTHVTLHVGAGTFLPVKVEDVTTHRMHAEWGEVTEAAAAEIAATRAAGGRIIPVGTTALRLIESAGRRDGQPSRPGSGDDRHLHLPRLPVPRHRCADDQFPPAEIDADDAGLGADGAGADARVSMPMPWPQRYRFFSYGDASLLIPEGAATPDKCRLGI